jgi:LCP family protein required for cell wall assembly
VLQHKGPERGRRRTLKWLVLGAAGLLTVAVLAAVGFAVYVGNTFDSSRHTIANPFPAVRAPKPSGAAAHSVNILLLGHDVDAVDSETPQFVGKQQADTVMLVHIPADRKHVYLMSILRNSLVSVPGHGQQAVNAALSFGGMPLQVQTVEQLLGVRVDHVVSVSLIGMKDLTDVLGGVTVRNPAAFTNDGFTFQPGLQRLDGNHALAYIRGGSNRAVGDAGRARAQTAYLKGILEDAFRAKTLLDPAALATAVSVISPYLTVDKGFDSSYVRDLGLSLSGIRAGDVRSFALPARKVRLLGSAHVLELDQGALTQVRQHLLKDSLEQYLTQR